MLACRVCVDDVGRRRDAVGARHGRQGAADSLGGSPRDCGKRHDENNAADRESMGPQAGCGGDDAGMGDGQQAQFLRRVGSMRSR